MKPKIRAYDNGGKTADRYTVIYMDEPERMPGMFSAVSMNAEPFHPQGIGMHCAAQPGPHLGKRIRFQDLPVDCYKLVLQDLNNAYPDDGMPEWYFFEHTDTYGGEANYCWVHRFKVRARSLTAALAKVSREAGLQGRLVKEYGPEPTRWNVRHAAQCVFGQLWEDGSHGTYSYVKTLD